MAHLWVRAEQRANEQRVGMTPEGVKQMLNAGHKVTVEQSAHRAIPFEDYAATGCEIADAGAWQTAPLDAVVFGLKELDPDGPALKHHHIMFGHAYKGQADGPALLQRFREGGGSLYDLEYLVEENGKRIAAFGYWAGFAGAAVGLQVWIAQQKSDQPGPTSVGAYSGRAALIEELEVAFVALQSEGVVMPNAIVIGALGRVGSGACDLFDALNVDVTRWDMAETAHGGPFPEILHHTLFVNCILAGPNVPVFVPKSALTATRNLSVVSDVSCDPSSSYNPIPIYSEASSFVNPVTRVHDDPVLDVTAIDNLPSMLPVESSQDYAAQLLPYLMQLDEMNKGVWGRAHATFETHMRELGEA